MAKKVYSFSVIIYPDGRGGDLCLMLGRSLIGKTSLTFGQGFDILLITALDNLLDENRIERLFIKLFKVRGKTRFEALSGMILETVRVALGV